MFSAGITGTNGKTSVATFTRQIWMALGRQAINLGTTGIEGAWTAPSSHTTPDALTLHAQLSAAAEAGITHAAMEASSHGLDQRRMDGVRLVAAGFTNFTQDHLDYHQTMEAYFQAKALLFSRLLPEGVYLTSIRQNAQVVAISGVAQTNERVSEFLRNALYNSTWLERPELVEIKASAVSSGSRERA